MWRPAQLCRRTLLLLLCAGAGVPICAHSTTPDSEQPPPAASAHKPTSTDPAHPDLQVDDSDPDRTRGERTGQGMTGERPVDVRHVEVPADSSQPEGTPANTSSLLSSRPAPAIAAGTAIPLRLTTSLSSAIQRNGDVIHGTLASPVETRSGKTLPAGTPVLGTVVS